MKLRKMRRLLLHYVILANKPVFDSSGTLTKNFKVKIIDDDDNDPNDLPGLVPKYPILTIQGDNQDTSVDNTVIVANIDVNESNLTKKILFDTNILASESKPLNTQFSYEVVDATATIREDYNVGSSTRRYGTVPVEFEPNGTNYDAYITLNIIDDQIHEDDETFKLILRNPQGAVFPLPTPPSQESDIIRKIEIPVTIKSDNDNELSLMNPITTSEVDEDDGVDKY